MQKNQCWREDKKMQNCKISVIMPAYNAEKTIDAAVKSVIGQTFQHWELLIVNDCSTDRTKEKILAWTKCDSRIHVIENPQNMGVAQTRNQGVAKAKGEWIAFLDSDDLWEPDKLEMQVKWVRKFHARLVFTGSAFIDKDGKRIDYCLNVPKKVVFRELLKQNIISCSSVLVQKKLLLRYPMVGKDMHEDYAVWLSILKNEGICAYGINRPLLVYRVSPKSKSGNKGKAALMHWRVYRHIGLGFIPSVYYFLWYMGRNLKKYGRIWRRMK